MRNTERKRKNYRQKDTDKKKHFCGLSKLSTSKSINAGYARDFPKIADTHKSLEHPEMDQTILVSLTLFIKFKMGVESSKYRERVAGRGAVKLLIWLRTRTQRVLIST